MGAHKYDQTTAQQVQHPANHEHKCFPGSEQQQLITNVYSHLPCELRHHIHTFCVQGSYDDEVVVRHGGEGRPILLARQPGGTHSYHWAEDPILLRLSPDRIGLVASREILETYYRTRTFKFVHEELQYVRSFVEIDTFGLALRPADHLRRLQLQIQPFKYAQLRDPASMRKEETTCCRALEALSALQSHRTAIDVHVDLTQGFSDEEEYEELLHDAATLVFRMVGLMQMLRMSGLNIEVILEGTWDEKSSVKLCSSSSPSLDEFLAKMKTSIQ